MTLLTILSFLVMAIVVGKAWIWLVNFFVNPLIRKAEKKANKPNLENPYISEHLARRINERSYEEYLKWLDEEGIGLPIDEILTRKEWEFQQKLKKQL